MQPIHVPVQRTVRSGDGRGLESMNGVESDAFGVDPDVDDPTARCPEIDRCIGRHRDRDRLSEERPRQRRRRPEYADRCERQIATCEREHGRSNVLGKNLTLQQCPLARRRRPGLPRPRRTRRRVGHPSPWRRCPSRYDTIGVDSVDPYAELAELSGKQTDLVGLIRLGRTVRDVRRAGEHAVLARDVDDVASQALLGSSPSRRRVRRETSPWPSRRAAGPNRARSFPTTAWRSTGPHC